MAPPAGAAQAVAQPAPPGSTVKGVAIESVNNLLDDLDAAFGAIVEPDSHLQDSSSAPPVSLPAGRELREPDLAGERGRREAIIVHSLLQQVDVPKVVIDKIYTAGLATLDRMFVARADEISAMTGVGEILASRIVEKFQRYRREAASLGDATRAPERRRLADLLAELRGLHQEFERAASGWSEDARTDKKRLRQARTETLLQVKVLLARLGEIDRLGRLERLPFGRKIEELEVYLRDAAAMKAPAR